MDARVPRVARYRFRATFGRRWGGYLSLVVLIAMVGGVAMAAAAAARRTQSSLPRLLASTNPSDLGGVTGLLNPLIGSNLGYDPSLIATIAHLPHVKQVESASGLNVLPLGPDGAPANVAGFPPQAGAGLGSVDGLYFNQDRITITAGRMSDPNRADEIVMQSSVATQTGFHVGDHIALGVYTNDQTQLPDFGTAKVEPVKRADVTLVGTGVVARMLVRDDVDESSSLALFTPAFTSSVLTCCANYSTSGIQVDGGRAEVAAVDAAIQRVLPKGFPAPSLGSDVYGKAERAIKPESLALGVFGGIAALAALIIAGQAIGRQVRLGAADRATLRALGATPVMTTSDAGIGILGAIVIGSMLACLVAVGLSPLAPIGPVRPVDPDRGLFVDWTVVGVGLVILVVGLAVLLVGLSVRTSPHRASSRALGEGRRRSGLARAARTSGLSAPAVTGIHFALEPGGGRDSVPVRSAVLGTVLAVVVVTSTLTFGASLHALVSHPPLYGWNWDYVMSAGGGSGNIPAEQATALLDKDPYVKAWSGIYSAAMQIDGQTVPILAENPNAAVQPPILTGHGLTASDEVVLGAVSLSQLNKHVGDTVTASAGSSPPTRLRIVGTAAMPTIGGVGGPHLEMATGALVSSDLVPAALRNPFNDPVTGPQAIFIRVRSGSSRAAALKSLQDMSTPLTTNFNFGVFVMSVLRPAEIVNYRSMTATPAFLGVALAFGAVSALGLTLVASVRRRRRDLALLKTLGFTRRQLAAAVAWQSSIAVAIGTAVGVPLGIVAGRALWSAFAREIHAVPTPTVPAVSIVVVAVASLVLANVVATIPGRMAARTPTALLLRAE